MISYSIINLEPDGIVADVGLRDSTWLKQGQCYPSLPIIRRAFPVLCKDDALKDRDEGGAEGCTKHSIGPNWWNPGVFTMYCACRRQRALGFHLLSSKETVRTFLNVLYSRFEKAPDLVVYDNCCNLHKHVMRFAPVHFASTKFVIDRVHQHGHVACSPAFKMDFFTQLDNVNSQICEQGNALIFHSDISSSACYMSQFNFMLSFRFFLFLYNMRQFCPRSDMSFAETVAVFRLSQK